MDSSSRKLDLRAAWVSVLGILAPVNLFHLALISISASDAVLLPAIITGLKSSERPRSGGLLRAPLARWIFAFAISVLIGFVVGWVRQGHLIWWALLNRLLGLFLLLSVYCLFAFSARQNVRLYLRYLVLGGSLINLAALVAAIFRYAFDYGGIFFFGHTSLRLSGLMHNPNQYGGFLALLIAVELTAMAFKKPIFSKLWVDAANTSALLLALIVTISRGSWLAALAGALAVPILTATSRGRMSRGVSIVPPSAVILCLVTVILISRSGGLWPSLQKGPPSKVSEDATSIYFPRGKPSFAEFLRIARDAAGASDRLAITHTALQFYAASPSTLAFGLGLGGFAETAATSTLQSHLIIHNSFLWALVELGPLGLICLLGIFQSSIRRLWATMRADAEISMPAAALLASLISVFAWCMSNDGVYQRHLWLLLGLATSIYIRQHSTHVD